MGCVRIWVVGLILLLAGARGAWADGMMAARIRVGAATEVVSSPKQEALLIRERDDVTVLLRTSFSRGPEEVAWIVPVPAKPDQISVGDDAVFTRLAQRTAPTFNVIEPRNGFSFGCAAQSAHPSSAVRPGVIVEAEGQADVFDYAVLAATRAEELTGWLTTNGYAVPKDATPTFGRYVEKSFHFLAMKLRPEAAAAQNVLTPRPIRYHYRCDSLVFPLVISRLSAAPRNEIILYVLAKERMGGRTFVNATANDTAFAGLMADPRSRSGTNYEALFLEATRREPHLLVTEFASDLDTVGFRPLLETLTGRNPLAVEHVPAPYLTRMRAVLTPEAMDRDLELVATKAGEVWNDHYLNARSVRSGQPLVGIMFGSLLFVAARGGRGWMRRSPRVKRAFLLLLIPAAMLFIML